jgi:hypothetical protein
VWRYWESSWDPETRLKLQLMEYLDCCFYHSRGRPGRSSCGVLVEFLFTGTHELSPGTIPKPLRNAYTTGRYSICAPEPDSSFAPAAPHTAHAQKVDVQFRETSTHSCCLLHTRRLQNEHKLSISPGAGAGARLQCTTFIYALCPATAVVPRRRERKRFLRTIRLAAAFYGCSGGGVRFPLDTCSTFTQANSDFRV